MLDFFFSIFSILWQNLEKTRAVRQLVYDDQKISHNYSKLSVALTQTEWWPFMTRQMSRKAQEKEISDECFSIVCMIHARAAWAGESRGTHCPVVPSAEHRTSAPRGDTYLIDAGYTSRAYRVVVGALLTVLPQVKFRTLIANINYLTQHRWWCTSIWYDLYRVGWTIAFRAVPPLPSDQPKEGYKGHFNRALFSRTKETNRERASALIILISVSAVSRQKMKTGWRYLTFREFNNPSRKKRHLRRQEGLAHKISTKRACFSQDARFVSEVWAFSFFFR